MKVSLLILLTIFSVNNSFSQTNYKLADNVAALANGSSLTELHQELIKGLSTDEEKLRSFYFWITNNINYDVNEWISPSNNWQKQEPSNVLRSKKAVCHGYSELFKTFCDLSEIKCYLVSGYSKRDNAFVNEGHTWNVVFVNNQWRPVDATWGAGGVNNQRKFVKEFDEKYFLTNPIIFLSNHYPFDPAWQLVPYPVKLTDYKKSGWKYTPPATGNVYHYNDTISEWEKNDIIVKRLLAAQRMTRMNPDDIESKKELTYAMFDVADDHSANGIRILSELYPKSKSQHTTATRANIPTQEFNLKLDSAYTYFSNADSFLKKIIGYSQQDRTDLEKAKKMVRHNMEVIRSEQRR